MKRAFYIFTILVTLVLQACNSPEDRKEIVKDLRVLAIKLTPPELSLSELPSQGSYVSASALIINPNGQAVETSWQLCPYQSSRSCVSPDWQGKQEDAFQERCAIISAMNEQESMSKLNPNPLSLLDSTSNRSAYYAMAKQQANAYTADIAASGAAESTDLAFNAFIQEDMFYAMFATSFTCGLGGVWPTVLLTASSPES